MRLRAYATINDNQQYIQGLTDKLFSKKLKLSSLLDFTFHLNPQFNEQWLKDIIQKTSPQLWKCFDWFLQEKINCPNNYNCIYINTDFR